MPPTLRIARPASNLARTTHQWAAWDLPLLTTFSPTPGSPFDGVILGPPAGPYHFEFTRCATHALTPKPTDEDLTVFYYPDEREWAAACAKAEAAGWVRVTSTNSYWEEKGRCYADGDGYVVVAARMAWTL